MDVIVPGSIIPGPSGDNTLAVQAERWFGTYGEVYKATDTVTGDTYAVKVPRVSILASPGELDDFRREARLTQEINHPNVVRVVHVEDANPRLSPYMVMEFLNDGTLLDRIEALAASGSLIPPDELLVLAGELIDGIAAVNAKMLHRDLKPNNIMMDAGHPKIADLGMAKIIGELTRSNTFKGLQNYYYMAPENWRAETNAIQLDMYCMGIILYQLTTLAYPYVVPTSANHAALRDMHLFTAAIPIETIRADVPIRFRHVISRLLEKSAKDRYTTWDEAKGALQELNNLQHMVNASAVDAILSAAKEQHDASVRAEAKYSSDEEGRAFRRKVSTFMEHKLKTQIDEVVTAYNAAHPAGGDIKIQWSSEGLDEPAIGVYTVKVRLPFGIPPSLRAHEVDPPLELTVGRVSHIVTLGSNTEAGTHFLLAQPDANDPYGEWVVCTIDVSALVQGVKRKQYVDRLPFDNRDDWNRLEASDHNVINGYDITYSKDVKEAFAATIARVIGGD